MLKPRLSYGHNNRQAYQRAAADELRPYSANPPPSR